MIQDLRAGEIDVGIGLTEGWVAGLGKKEDGDGKKDYQIVGTYVETPLCKLIPFQFCPEKCQINYLFFFFPPQNSLITSRLGY
jgi:hypothetical protein